MKKIAYIFLIAVMIFSLGACAAQSGEEKQDQTVVQEETAPDADWNIPETVEMTDEVTEMFNKAMEDLTGVDYVPEGLLGEKDGTYCILCRATVIYPDAKPYWSLVYVNDEGVQNIWDIWMGAHAEKSE